MVSPHPIVDALVGGDLVTPFIPLPLVGSSPRSRPATAHVLHPSTLGLPPLLCSAPLCSRSLPSAVNRGQNSF